MAAKSNSSNASHRNIQKTPDKSQQAVQKNKLTPQQQFEIFLKSQPLKDGKRILWMKPGHEIFIWVDATDLNNIKGWETGKIGEGVREKTHPIQGDVFNSLSQWAKRKEGGVFSLYNRPFAGPYKKDVTSSDDIGIEIDSLSTDEQKELYRLFTEVTGIEFALKVSSGGKSIHAHIKANEFLPVEQIQYLQRLAVIAFRSDPVTDRPAQAMRVPGFYRLEKKAYQNLISHSDERYSVNQLLAGFRKWFTHMGWESPESIPDDWWSKELAPIYRSSSEYDADGKITATGAVLAEGYEGWVNRKQAKAKKKPPKKGNGFITVIRNEEVIQRLKREGKLNESNGSFNSLIDAVNEANALAEPEDFEEFNWESSGNDDHARGQCPFHDGDSGTSAWLKRDDDDVLKFHCASCTYNEPRDLFEYRLALDGKIDIEDPEPLTGKEWVQEAKKFIRDQGIEWIPPELEEFFRDEQQSAEELNTLISEGNSAPPHLFSDPLSNALTNLANNLGLPVEAFIVCILPILASRLKAGTHLTIDPTTDYHTPPILWAGLVGDSGTLKTPILKALTKPLDEIQHEEFTSYQQFKALYEMELQEWNSLSKKEKGSTPQPQPPALEDLYFSDFTIEAIADSISNYPDEGYLVHIDELAGFFKSMDAYRNGKGSDRQRWLTSYGGGALKVNRKSSEPIYLHQTSISLVGGIQPSVLEKQVLNDPTSEDGLWARFIWVRLPMTTPPGIGDSPKSDLSPILKGLYTDLNQLEAKTYTLSTDAKPLWNQWNDEIGQLIKQEPSGILRAAYPKLKEVAARIALIIHLTNSALARAAPGGVIPADTLNDAIRFTRWLMNQTKMLYCEIGTSDNPETAKILRFVNRFGGCDWVNARTVSQWSGRPRPKATDAREFMAKLVALGYANDNGESQDSSQFKIQVLEIGQQANKINESLSE